MTKSQNQAVPTTTSSVLRRSCLTQCSVFRTTLVLMMMLATILQSTFAFTSSSSAAASGARVSRFGVPNSHHYQQQQQRRCLVIISNSRFTPLARDDSASAVLLDAKGQQVQVGTIIRVVVDHLKAYQVSLPGYGKYGPDKKFVPVPPGGPRGTKNLLLPVGIRGVVSKLYDVDDVSANHPIQVKFFPGKNVDEGYDPPVPFIMHFSPEEIECV